MSATNRNLTDQIAQLRSTLGKMEIALGSISDAIVWTNSAAEIQWCNRPFDGLVGLPHIYVLGKSIIRLLPLWEHGVQLPEKAHPIHTLIDRHQDVHRYVQFDRDGKFLHLELSGTFVQMDASDASAVIVLRDVTAVEELKQLRLESVALQAAANAIAITDSAGLVIWINAAFTRLTGYEMEDIYGNSMKMLKSGKHSRRFYDELWNTIRSGRVWEGDTINRKKDGRLYVEHQTITPVRDVRGDITHFISIKEDISRRRKAEEELNRYKNKLEDMVRQRTSELEKTQKELIRRAIEAARAQWSAMILHNIGNAVTPINATLEVMKSGALSETARYLKRCFDDLSEHSATLGDYITRDERGRRVFSYLGELIQSITGQETRLADGVARIEGALSYVSEILTLQQSYVAREQENRERTSVNRLIDDALRMQLVALEKRGIRVVKHLDPAAPDILIDKSRLIQVLVNVIKNSYEAIDAAGPAPDEKTLTAVSRAEAHWIAIEIRDTGMGITPADAEQVFELGKSQKGSTGFGLYYCRKFIEDNGGTIRLESAGQGRGTTARIRLPVSPRGEGE